jgi:FkbM family methyltransferase
MGLTIVQFGANQGDDDLTKLIRALPATSVIDRLVLVEPLHVHHQALRKCYRDLNPEILAVAITTTGETATTLYYHEDDGPYFEVASLDRNHIAKHAQYNPKLAAEDRLRSVSVPSVSPGEFLRRVGITTPDILFVDCEGADGEIVTHLLNDGHLPVNLFFEHCHLRDESVYSLLAAKGYSVVRHCLTNGWMSFAAREPSPRLIPVT